jgi:iron complex outermembrane recepter protein
MRLLSSILVRAVGTAAATLLLLGGAWARAVEAAPAFFDIGPQSLATALDEFARQSHEQLLFAPEIVASRRSPGVHGTMEPEAALRLLLKDSGLSYSMTPAGTYLVGSSASAFEQAAANPATQSSPAEASKEGGKKSSQDFRLAQVAQATTGPQVGEGKSEEKKSAVVEEVVVTGTYLHDTTPITPVTTFTQAEIINQGYSRLDDFVFNLPQNFQAGSSPSSNPVNGFGNGAAYNYTYASGINLRGLGAGATLVLLNGHRMAPTANGGVTDVSQIPLSVIDRIEILTDGASALYGSDAVAGVVNIITKKDFSGVEVGARSTEIAQGKTPNYGGDLVGGFDWGTGGAVSSFDYEKDNPLYARNRSFSDTLADPTLLIPKNEASHLYLALHHDFSDQLTLSVDALASERKYQTESAANGIPPYTSNGRVNQYNTAAELDYKLTSQWTATLVGSYAREQDVDHDFSFGEFIYEPVGYDQSSIEPRIDGTLFTTPAGAVRLALGGQMRWESINYSQTVTPAGAGNMSAQKSRHLSSAYAEISIPIVGSANAVPLVRRLRLDLSGRYDDYSDFGHSSNPKVGLEWAPLSGVTVHSSYARSFQAPSLFDSSNALSNGYVVNAPDPSKGPGGSSLVFEIDGTNPSLRPETARSFDVGLTYEPENVGLKIDASYFSVDFDNQINRLILQGFFYNVLQQAAALGGLVELNPTAAEVNAQFAVPGRTFYNFAGPPGTYQPAPYSRSDIAAIANIGFVNTGSVEVRGLDLTTQYVSPVTSVGRFTTAIDGSYYLRYEQKQTPGAQAQSIINTLYNPLRFRAKADFGWDAGGWTTNARVNFSKAYGGASDPHCFTAPNCAVSSWTTLDLGFSYSPQGYPARSWLNGLRISVIATNVFNRDPPSVPIQSTFGYGYDPVNANPLLRAFGITFTKHWNAW